jgi:hypothetical protein
MPLHHTLACEPPASRRLRRWVPLLLFLGLIAVALVPGLIANDRPFQANLCDDFEQTGSPCAPLQPTISAAMDADAQPGQMR